MPSCQIKLYDSGVKDGQTVSRGDSRLMELANLRERNAVNDWEIERQGERKLFFVVFMISIFCSLQTFFLTELKRELSRLRMAVEKTNNSEAVECFQGSQTNETKRNGMCFSYSDRVCKCLKTHVFLCDN